MNIVNNIENSFFPEVYSQSLPTSDDLSLCLFKKKGLAKYILAVKYFDSNLDIHTQIANARKSVKQQTSAMWLFKEVGGDTSLMGTGLFWISRLGLLGCLAFPLIGYMIMQSTGERIQMEAFIGVTLAFWVGGIIGALAINKVFFGQTSVWATKKDSSNDSSN